MVKARSLIILVLILMLTLGALAYFYFYVLNSGNEKVKAEGMVHLFSIYGWGPNPDQIMMKPSGVASDDQGNIYVTLPGRGKVVVFDRTGRYLFSFGSRGMAPGSLRGPLGIAVDSKRGRIYVADRVRFRLVIFNMRGKFVKESVILSPVTPAVGKDRIYLGTFGPLAVMSLDGRVLETWGARSREIGGFDYPHGIAVDSRGNIYVSDTNNTRLTAMNKKGDIQWGRGEPPKGVLDPKKGINLPAGLTIDDQDRLFLVDSFDFTIRVFNTRGAEIYKFGTGTGGNLEGQFNMPDGIAYMGNHTFAIADKYNNRVQVVKLLLPGEGSPFEGFPWWLLLLIPLLLALLRRKKFIANEDFIELVVENKKLRLLARVAKQVHVSPAVLEKFMSYEEEQLKFKDVATARDYKDKEIQVIMEKYDIGEDTAVYLALSKKRLQEKLMLNRFTLAFEDTKVREIIENENKKKPKMVNYEEFIELYEVPEEEASQSPA